MPIINSHNPYYVYMYLDPDNTPFYIGKGIRYRYSVASHLQKSHRNKFLQYKILKVGIDNIKIVFLHKDLTELESFALESQYIQRIGRRDLKQGPLCNLTNGGEIGPTGYKQTEDAKRKIGLANKGFKNSNYGKPAINFGVPHTKETKRKISIAAINRFKTEENPFKGKKHSEATKDLIRKSHIGKPAWNKGIPRTAEEKKKMSVANKGRVAWNKGLPHTERTKQKISRANKGKIRSEEFKHNVSTRCKGSKHSEETKQRMSLAAIKRFQLSGGHSEEAKRKISEANKGKPSGNLGKKMSEESKQKMIKSLKGRIHAEETKRKIGLANKGHTHSEETKRKIGESRKGCMHSKEAKQKIREAALRHWRNGAHN